MGESVDVLMAPYLVLDIYMKPIFIWQIVHFG